MNILVVDDHVLFRDGLIQLLTTRPEYRVIGEAGTVSEAVEKAKKLRPDLVLMDFTLQDGTGLEATQAILAQWPGCNIVFLTVSDDDETLIEAMRSGARGYILKNVSIASLFANLKALEHGEMVISHAMSARVIEGMVKEATTQPRITSRASWTGLT